MNVKKKNADARRLFLRASLERCEARDCMAGDFGLAIFPCLTLDAFAPVDAFVEQQDQSGVPVGSSFDSGSLDQAIQEMQFDGIDWPTPEGVIPWLDDNIGGADFETFVFGNSSVGEDQNACSSLLVGNDGVETAPLGNCTSNNPPTENAVPVDSSAVQSGAQIPGVTQTNNPSETAATESNASSAQKVEVPQGSVTPQHNPTPSSNGTLSNNTESSSTGLLGPQAPTPSEIIRTTETIAAEHQKSVDPGLASPVITSLVQEQQNAFTSFNSLQMMRVAAGSVINHALVQPIAPTPGVSTGSSQVPNYFASNPTNRESNKQQLPVRSDQEVAQVFEFVQIAGRQSVNRTTSGLFSVDSNAAKNRDSKGNRYPLDYGPSRFVSYSPAPAAVKEANKNKDIESDATWLSVSWRLKPMEMVLVFVGILTFWDENKRTQKISREIGTKFVTNRNFVDPFE